jgi:hypothetical protein
MLVVLQNQIARGLPTQREPETPPDQVLFDTRGSYWVGWETMTGQRVWSEGPTLNEARRSAADSFKKRHGETIVRLETRIAPDGNFWFYVLPLVITESGTRQKVQK